MTLGIRGRLFLISLALIAISLVASEIYLTRTLHAQLVERIRADLLLRARLVAQRVAAAAAPIENTAVYDALADEMAGAAGARVTLVRKDGAVAGDSEVELAALTRAENHGGRPEIIDALSTGEGASVRFSTTTNRRLMYVAVPVVRNGETIATARLAMPLDEIDQTMTNLHKTLAGAGLLALLVAAALSWLAAQLTSRRLREFTDIARHMAAGSLSARTRASGRDEIAALGTALDQLAASLSRTLDSLRGERDLLTGILSSMSEGVLVVGDDRRIVLTNPALRAMLLTGPDPVGKNVLHVIRNADLIALLEDAAQGVAPEMELDLTGLLPRRVLVRAITLSAQPGAVLAVFVDLTELRRLESVRRDFVANASHELRSPLTSVRAAAETLAAVKDDPEAAARFIESIRRNAERLENLVTDMLELSRIESRELRLQIEPVDLHAAAKRVVSQHAHRAKLKNMDLTNAVAGTLMLRADRRALEHVLENLVDNALKYCPEGASVRVDAAPADGLIRVAVADTGAGIAPEHLPRLFERFYRVDPGRSRELGGTGLGLAIVKHLVEAMGGTVAAESRLGVGSVFSFTLKAA